jgi:hypothetical protein
MVLNRNAWMRMDVWMIVTMIRSLVMNAFLNRLQCGKWLSWFSLWKVIRP